MKRAIRRTFRRIRHRICRNIYYFDSCPIECRKNFKNLLLEGLACMALCVAGIAFFFALAIIC